MAQRCELFSDKNKIPVENNFRICIVVLFNDFIISILCLLWGGYALKNNDVTTGEGRGIGLSETVNRAGTT